MKSVKKESQSVKRQGGDAELASVFAKIDTLSVQMNALTEVFHLITTQTAEYAVVHPLAELGQKIATNLTDDMFAILNNVGELCAPRGSVAV